MKIINIKIIAKIQILIGILILLFPIYHIYTNYMNVETYGSATFVKDIINNYDILSKTATYKNISLSPQINYQTSVEKTSTILSTIHLSKEHLTIILFELLIISLIGLNFIFTGLNNLVKEKN